MTRLTPAATCLRRLRGYKRTPLLPLERAGLFDHVAEDGF